MMIRYVSEKIDIHTILLTIWTGRQIQERRGAINATNNAGQDHSFSKELDSRP